MSIILNGRIRKPRDTHSETFIDILNLLNTKTGIRSNTVELQSCIEFAGGEVHKPIHRRRIGFVHAVAACIGAR